jgi:hypothetical protein
VEDIFFHYGKTKLLKFLFINIYAFLLVIGGIAIIFIPNNIIVYILKWLAGLLCLYGAISIFSMWKRKKRMIKVLLKRNENVINYDSFKPYMETFCTQLVVIYVLKKMKRMDIFFDLYPAWLKACSGDNLPGTDTE